jgi:hypothetical protein
MNFGHIGAILAFFNGKPVTQDLLNEFCNLNKFDVITPGQYEEFRGQQEHDERVMAMLPTIFAELSAFRHIPEYIGDNEKKALRESNDDIEWRIAKIVEDSGIPYGREIDVVFRNLANALQGIVTNAGVRMNNMCAASLSAIAKQKFGEKITVAQLGTFYRTEVLKQQVLPEDMGGGVVVG